MLLEEFNEIDRESALTRLRPCIDVSRWGEEIVDGRPFASSAALLKAAATAAQPFTAGEIESALAHHPRIGERAGGASQEATLSRAEQAGVDPTDAAVASALAAGNLAYERKFGRVFLIRAAGRTAGEILAALNERLEHSADDEEFVVEEQLRQIALLRLEGLVSS